MAVANPHDLLDFSERLVASRVLARQHGNHRAANRRRASERACGACPVQRLMRRLRNDHEIVLRRTDACRGTLAEHADDGELRGADAHFLVDRIETALGKEHLVRRVAEHHDFPPVLNLGR